MKINPSFVENLESILSGYPTPCYVFNLSGIRSTLDELRSMPYDVRFFAATMANDIPEILQIYKDHGFGIFVNSDLHLELGKRLGFNGSDIVWTSTGMTEAQMKSVKDYNVIRHLDSLGQLSQWGRLYPNTTIGLRINLVDMPICQSYAGAFVGPASRIGLIPQEFDAAKNIAHEHNLTVNGLHVYLGTDNSNIEHFATGAWLLGTYAQHFPDLEYLDMGGGFSSGIDLECYNRDIPPILRQISKAYCRDLRLYLEPGRILTSAHGVFVTTITDIKHRSEKDVVVVDSSCSQFPQKMFYPDKTNPQCSVIGKIDRPYRLVDIAGNTTYSRDYLSTGVYLPEDIRVGDRLVFKDAGAYCHSMSTQFLGKCPAQTFFIEK